MMTTRTGVVERAIRPIALKPRKLYPQAPTSGEHLETIATLQDWRIGAQVYLFKDGSRRPSIILGTPGSTVLFRRESERFNCKTWPDK
jgi:hypothetical protein